MNPKCQALGQRFTHSISFAPWQQPFKACSIIVLILQRRQLRFLKIQTQLCLPQKHLLSAVGLRKLNRRGPSLSTHPPPYTHCSFVRAGRCISFQVISPQLPLNECFSAKWNAITQGPKLNTPFPIPPADPQGSTGSRTWSPQPRPSRWLPASTARVKPGVAGWAGLSPEEAHRSRKSCVGGTGSNSNTKIEAACGPAPQRARPCGFGHLPRVAARTPCGFRPRSWRRLPLWSLRLENSQTTGAEKRRAKFLFISYEWGEGVCRTPWENPRSPRFGGRSANRARRLF